MLQGLAYSAGQHASRQASGGMHLDRQPLPLNPTRNYTAYDRMFTSGMRSSHSAEHATPQWLFDELNAVYDFTRDPCSTHDNTKCARHFTKEDDDRDVSWSAIVLYRPEQGVSIPKQQLLW